MSASSVITGLGITIILIYSLSKILDFYGVGVESYGKYFAFYFFLLLSSFILPRYYPTIK